MRAATPAADPPLDPPGTRLVSHGLRVGLTEECSVDEPIANSSRFVFPTIDAPRARRRAMAVASNGDRKSARIRDPQVDGMSVVTMLSFTQTGSGAATASRLTARNALTSPSRRSMAARQASTYWRG